jgi:hypothetical protein
MEGMSATSKGILVTQGYLSFSLKVITEKQGAVGVYVEKAKDMTKQ